MSSVAILAQAVCAEAILVQVRCGKPPFCTHARCGRGATQYCSEVMVRPLLVEQGKEQTL